ncbi:MAG: carboxylating nicotinate-nucleotide diphosphorylase [Rhodospirillales bacterium]|nr:carboxylating nicotinate-nucleotide diphosphorylase [Rhodospirillales bacterium]
MTSKPARLVPLEPLLFEPAVRAALEEDLGRAGDLTTDALIPAGTVFTAQIRARKPGRIAGLDLAATAFRLLDGNVRFEVRRPDGSDAEAGDVLAEVEGDARALLSAERVALNFLGHLSGIATATREIVAAVGDRNVRVTCTRKTTPGLRFLEKYAIRAGGGANHRFGLDDGILIKDNHVAVAGGIAPAIERARAFAGHMVKIEIEVDTLEQLEQALAAGADAILLDNMDVPTMKKAVDMIAGRAITEASGGITAATAADIAATGVDILSAGWLTHSAPSLDVGLDISS